MKEEREGERVTFSTLRQENGLELLTS